jgi:hypothetical protein
MMESEKFATDYAKMQLEETDRAFVGFFIITIFLTRHQKGL